MKILGFPDFRVPLFLIRVPLFLIQSAVVLTYRYQEY